MTNMLSITARMRVYTTLGLTFIVPLGFGLKFYRGPGQSWVNNYGPASIAYEIFFMFLAFLFLPRNTAITLIAVGVCLVTCGLEFAQLWHPWWFEMFNSYPLGQAFLGHRFSWWDFPAYPLGCLVGWYLLHGIYTHVESRGSDVES